MFKKIMLIILSACELFLCYLAFFKKDGSAGGTEQAAYGIELAERFMTDKEKALYRQTVEKLRKISIGEDDYYPEVLELSEPFESAKELDTATEKVAYFAERYAPEYTYWLDSLEFVGEDNNEVYAIFYVSPEYQYDYENDDLYDYYENDDDFWDKLGHIPAEKVEVAQKAINNAKEIAAKYQGKSDYEKIMGYVEEICALNVYNDEAAAAIDKFDEYGKISPWRIVNVFDGDPETNVLCGGYAEAFMYLCGLGGIECHYIYGFIDSGAHAWNTVTLGGVNYFADVTSCDTIGYSDAEIKRHHPFILTGVAESCPDKFESDLISPDGKYYSTVYKYGDKTIKYIPEDIRLLSTKNYPSKRLLYILMGAVLVGIVLCALPKRKRKDGVSDNYDNHQWSGE